MTSSRPPFVGVPSLLLVTALLSPGCGLAQRIGTPPIDGSAALKNAHDRRVLIVVSAHAKLGETGKPTGYWLSEVTHFYHVVARHGLPIDFASPGGRPSVMDPGSFSLGDDLNRSFWENPYLKEKLQKPLSPEGLDPARYVAIYFAGGHGTMWDFPEAAALARLAARIYESGGIVSAVCHGPAGLLGIKLSNGDFLVKGRKVTGFANTEETIVLKRSAVPYLLEDALKERGGVYSKALFPFSAHVVVDGRLITGQNPGSATGVGEALVRVLASASVDR